MTGYQTYARTSIETSDPRQLVVLLYEGAIRFLRQALESIERNERKEMSTLIKKAQAIIHHLSNALDFDSGEEVARNLSRLYDYMRDTLAQANIQADAAKIREVIDLIQPLLEAWRHIAKDPEAANALIERKRKSSPSASPVETSENPTSQLDIEENPTACEEPLSPGAPLHVTVGADRHSSPQTPAVSSSDRIRHLRPPEGANTIAARAAYGIR